MKLCAGRTTTKLIILSPLKLSHKSVKILVENELLEGAIEQPYINFIRLGYINILSLVIDRVYEEKFRSKR